jgi:flagellar biosynthetic protein FlhB
MAEQEQQRSEKATPWKLEQARKKGTVPKGMDLNSFVAIAVLIATLHFTGMHLFAGLARLFSTAMSIAGDARPAGPAFRTALALFFENIKLLAGMIVALMALGMLASFAQTGPVLSFTPLKPDFSRLNPAQGMKRFFNTKLLFDSTRAVLKAIFLCSVIYFFLRHAIPAMLSLMHAEIRSYPRQILELTTRLLMYCLAALLPIALLDIFLSRHDFMKRMMMSRRELLEEHKHREGDPRIRSRQRALQKEARLRSASLRRVKEADVLITNPTHLAIALKYEPGTMPAPVVLAKGAGHLAAMMREMAWRHRIPVVQNRRLAAKLFRNTPLEQPIAQDCYVDVARILIWLRSRMHAVN